MSDYGMLQGLAEGVASGMDAYRAEKDRQFKIKQYQDQLDAKKLAQQIDLKSHGLLQNPDTGEVDFTPEEQQKRQQQGLLGQAQVQEAQAKAQESKAHANYFQSQAGAPGQMSKIEMKDMKDDQKALQSDPDYKAATKGLSEIGLAKSQLAQARAGNAVAGNMMPVMVARLSTGGQRLNQQEIKMAGGSQAVGAKIDQAIQQMKDGTLTKENADFVDQLITASEKAEHDNLESVVNRHAIVRASNKGIDPDEAYRQLTGTKRNSGGLLQNQPQGLLQQGGANPHPMDSAAVQWAKQNPQDPRSAAILKANGM